jgi:hypothetical protein
MDNQNRLKTVAGNSVSKETNQRSRLMSELFSMVAKSHYHKQKQFCKKK